MCVYFTYVLIFVCYFVVRILCSCIVFLFLGGRVMMWLYFNAQHALIVCLGYVILLQKEHNILCYKSWNFRGDIIQWYFLGQTASSGCEGFLTFRELRPHHQGMELAPETSAYLHILTQLAARENFIEIFCWSENLLRNLLHMSPPPRHSPCFMHLFYPLCCKASC